MSAEIDEYDDKIFLEQEKERKKITAVYFVFFLSFVIALIPVSVVSLFAFMINVCTLAYIYSARSNADEDSFTENHMHYLIITFWRTSLYFFIAAMFAALYIVIFTNYISLKPCIGLMDEYLTAAARNLDFSRFFKVFNSCEKAFMKDNKITFIITTLLAFVPPLAYISYRYVKGWMHFIKNEPIPDVKP